MSAITVSQLIYAVKGDIESKYGRIHIEGEVSNLSMSSSGHWYFSLSDADSLISCS